MKTACPGSGREPPRAPTEDIRPVQTQWTLDGVRERTGLDAASVRRLVQAGVVAPVPGPDGQPRFGFQDVVVLRTAAQLRSQGVNAARITRALVRLRQTLPPSLPLAGLRIVAEGDQVSVRAGGTHWHAESGQLLLDWQANDGEPAGVTKTPTTLHPSGPTSSRSQSSRTLDAPESATQADVQARLQRALQLEERGHALEAIVLLRGLMQSSPRHADALLNLGVLLGQQTSQAARREAVTLYGQALAWHPAPALLHYNRAIVLEDLGLPDEACADYEQALALDPQLADAHYNLARLHESQGRAQNALRHYAAYRKLSR